MRDGEGFQQRFVYQRIWSFAILPSAEHPLSNFDPKDKFRRIPKIIEYCESHFLSAGSCWRRKEGIYYGAPPCSVCKYWLFTEKFTLNWLFTEPITLTTVPGHTWRSTKPCKYTQNTQKHTKHRQTKNNIHTQTRRKQSTSWIGVAHTYKTKNTLKTQTNNVTQQDTENKFTDTDTIHDTAISQFVIDLCTSWRKYVNVYDVLWGLD